MSAAVPPSQAPGVVLLTAAEITLEARRAPDKRASEAAIEHARYLAQQAGPRATRRHNLAIACSMAGGQVALALRLAEATGTKMRSKKAAIARVLADERALSEECALLIERVMGWGYYRMTTEWIERRRAPAHLPSHTMERRHWRL